LQATVARNIAYSRSRRVMTMRQLEQAAELPVGYASLIERTSPDLKIEMVERVANALDEKVSELLDANFGDEP
jgi:transcriptional regulator with XRE-family HTH domain